MIYRFLKLLLFFKFSIWIILSITIILHTILINMKTNISLIFQWEIFNFINVIKKRACGWIHLILSICLLILWFLLLFLPSWKSLKGVVLSLPVWGSSWWWWPAWSSLPWLGRGSSCARSARPGGGGGLWWNRKLSLVIRSQ